MDFSKRLNRLMTIMGTSNSRLAMALNVDASLVSRWRTGSRSPKKVQGHAQSIAGYYVRTSQADFQRRALMVTMGQEDREGPAPTDAELTAMLSSWLVGGYEEAAAPVNPAPEEVSRNLQVHLHGPAETDTVFLSFLEQVERPDGGDLFLLMTRPEPWLLGEGDYEYIHRAFRTVLLSGRRVTLGLNPSLNLDWIHVACLWADLGFLGDFTVLALTEPIEASVVFAAFCSRMACVSLNGEGESGLFTCTQRELIALLAAFLHPIRERARSMMRSAEESDARTTEPIRLHTGLNTLAESFGFSGQQVLVLPHLNHWKRLFDRIDPEIVPERLQLVVDQLTAWEERIRTDGEGRYALYTGTYLHEIRWSCMDVRMGERPSLSDVRESSRRVYIEDGRWLRTLRRFFGDSSHFLQDRETICHQLEAYRSRLLFQFGQRWTVPLGESVSVSRRLEHPLYGACVEWREGEDGAAQYYRVEEDRIVILALNGDGSDGFLGRLQSLFADLHLPLICLVPMGEDAAWTYAQEKGFVPTGRILCADGSTAEGKNLPLASLRAEMRYTPEWE